LRIYRPHNLETATMVTAAYQRFYNEERPHQGISCDNVPPRVAFPTLPLLPKVPAIVDADRWLHTYDGHSFVRRVQRGGQVMVADVPYYIKATLAKQQVAFRVDAATGQFVVEADGRAVQRVAIKGLGLGTLPFDTFVERLCGAAQTVRRTLLPTRTYRRMRHGMWHVGNVLDLVTDAHVKVCRCGQRMIYQGFASRTISTAAVSLPAT